MRLAHLGRVRWIILYQDMTRMRRITTSIPLLLITTGALFAGSVVAQGQGEPAVDAASVLPAYERWAAALEQDTPVEAVWQLPFGAPRPADLTAQDLKVVLSLRRLVMNGEKAEMEDLAGQVARRRDPLPPQMRFWLAYIQGQLGQTETCLANLEILLTTPDAWRSLENGQRSWVLTQTADLLFLLERRTAAAACYARLAASPLDQLQLWGKYQLAGTAFLNRDFAGAQQLYFEVCNGDRPAHWHGHACAMAALAEQLSRLPKAGDTHGAMAAAAP
jgi:hypothetical protein